MLSPGIVGCNDGYNGDDDDDHVDHDHNNTIMIIFSASLSLVMVGCAEDTLASVKRDSIQVSKYTITNTITITNTQRQRIHLPV